MEFKKRFSIAHPEQDMQQYPNHYYLILKNTPEETLDEIEDIYFGKNLEDKENLLVMLWVKKQLMNI